MMVAMSTSSLGAETGILSIRDFCLFEWCLDEVHGEGNVALLFVWVHDLEVILRRPGFCFAASKCWWGTLCFLLVRAHHFHSGRKRVHSGLAPLLVRKSKKRTGLQLLELIDGVSEIRSFHSSRHLEEK